VESLLATALIEVMGHDFSASCAWLNQAQKAGWHDPKMLADPGWEPIREDPEFRTLLASVVPADVKTKD
jgi:hypothetical protein